GARDLFSDLEVDDLAFYITHTVCTLLGKSGGIAGFTIPLWQHEVGKDAIVGVVKGLKRHGSLEERACLSDFPALSHGDILHYDKPFWTLCVEAFGFFEDLLCSFQPLGKQAPTALSNRFAGVVS